MHQPCFSGANSVFAWFALRALELPCTCTSHWALLWAFSSKEPKTHVMTAECHLLSFEIMQNIRVHSFQSKSSLDLLRKGLTWHSLKPWNFSRCFSGKLELPWECWERREPWELAIDIQVFPLKLCRKAGLTLVLCSLTKDMSLFTWAALVGGDTLLPQLRASFRTA